MAAGEVLVEIRIVPAVELVDGHLPDGMRAGRTVLRVAVALVRHPEHHNEKLTPTSKFHLP